MIFATPGDRILNWEAQPLGRWAQVPRHEPRAARPVAAPQARGHPRATGPSPPCVAQAQRGPSTTSDLAGRGRANGVVARVNGDGDAPLRLANRKAVAGQREARQRRDGVGTVTSEPGQQRLQSLRARPRDLEPLRVLVPLATASSSSSTRSRSARCSRNTGRATRDPDARVEALALLELRGKPPPSGRRS